MDGGNWWMYILHNSLLNRDLERIIFPSMNLRAVPSQAKGLFEPAESFYREIGVN